MRRYPKALWQSLRCRNQSTIPTLSLWKTRTKRKSSNFRFDECSLLLFSYLLTHVRQITTKKDPPPGFAFVPIGNPQLTTACKEISRERDAMIFIVSVGGYKPQPPGSTKLTHGSQNSKEAEPTHLASQIHRMGHHIRETIVEEARATLSHFPVTSTPISNGEPEPIPDSQEEYRRQADDAIRDLFPRIPNTDRDMIITHSFTRVGSAVPIYTYYCLTISFFSFTIGSLVKGRAACRSMCGYSFGPESAVGRSGSYSPCTYAIR